MNQRRNLTTTREMYQRRTILLLFSVFAGFLILSRSLFVLGETSSAAHAQSEMTGVEATPTPTPDPSGSIGTQSAQTSYTAPGIEVGDRTITQTVVQSVAQGSDDAGMNASNHDCVETRTADEVYIGWCDDGTYGTTPVTSGVRFDGVSFPADMILADAYLEVTVEGGYTRDIPETRIYGEAVSNSPTFSPGDMPWDRLDSQTSNYALWNTTLLWDGTAGVYRSPSLLTVTQEVMGAAGWETNDPITFLLISDSNITHGGRDVHDPIEGEEVHHRFRSEDYSSGEQAPHLVLVYTQTRQTEDGTLVAAPVEAVADGIDTLTVTVTVSDTYGLLVGKEISLTSTGPVSVTWPTGNVTDDNGQAQAHITSTLPQTTTLSAYVVDDDVTLAQMAVVTFTDVPIAGLQASDDSPTIVGDTTALTATITAGTSVSYLWDFGDGTVDSGSAVTHIYPAAGVYTAIVTASNSANVISDTTSITITDVPIAGLTASNDGPTLVDDPITFVASITQGTNVNYTWAFGDGTTGEGIQATHTYTAGGSYTAVVTATNSANTVTATTPVEVLAPTDLNLAKSGLSLVPAGAPLDYEISVANDGVEPASDVIVTDTLPAETQFVSQDSPYAYTYDPQAHTVVWTIPLLPDGNTEIILLQTQVVSDAVVGTQLVNTVSSTLHEEDVSLQNNQAAFTTTVSAPPAGPDLTLTKTGPAHAIAGTAMTYKVTVLNIGDLPAAGVVISDTLPQGTTYTGSSHPAYNTTYNAATNTVVWAVGALAAGDSYQISLQVQAPLTVPVDPIINSATVAAEADVNASNDWALFQTEILAAAPQLTITPATNGTANGAAYLAVQEGYTATRVVTVTNTGTDVLTGGVAVMEEPASAGVNYSWLTVDPLLTTADLAPGEAVTFTIEADNTSVIPSGNYYDIIGFHAPDDERVSARPFYLRVYAHPPLHSFTVPVTNTLNEAVPEAQVMMEKQNGSVWMVDGSTRPETHFAQTQLSDGSGIAAFSTVEQGAYTLTVSAPGHRSATSTVTIPDDLINGQLPLPTLLALPGLVFEPAQNVNISVTSGEFAYFTYRIRNEGPAPAENFDVKTPFDLPWVSSGLPAGVTYLAKGEAMSVTLFLDTPVVTADELHEAVITVTADYVEPAHLQAEISVLISETGDLEMTVTDLTGVPVANADVWVTNKDGRIVNGPDGEETVYDTQTGATDAYGQLSLSELPPATYDYYVQADGYYYETGTTQVQSGQLGPGVNQTTVQMTSDPFTYDWTVEETTITDTYAITVDITYEADVLEPKLFVSGAVFCPGEPINYLVANVGPVTMTNIILDPNHRGVGFGPVDPVTVGELAPGEAFAGTFSTSGSPHDSAKFGHLNVTADYETGGGIFDYTTSNWTDKHCPRDGSGGEGGWTWSWHNGHVIGSSTSSSPRLPRKHIPTPSDHEVARLILSGDATLERQAFNARLEISSVVSETIQDFTIDIEARDGDGLAVVNGFAVTPTLPTRLGDLAGGATVAGEWLIVPGDLGITDTDGITYNLRAQIVYTYANQVYTITTIPEPITVYPQPFVRLRYSHTQPDEQGDFYVEIAARNDGYGVAEKLKLDLSEVTTLGDLDGNGRALVFELEEATLNGEAQPLEYIFDFGDMAPGEEIVGRWRIGVHADDGMPLTDQVITGFDVACKHEPYQGLELSALINCGVTNQPYLTDDCPFCGIGGANLKIGGPINTANGNYTYRQSTPSINTAAIPLQFTWTYNSLNTGVSPDFPVLSSTLGLGWTHNYQMVLDLSQVDGPDPVAVVRAPHGTPIYFHVTRDGFTPVPGAHATMTATEVITDRHIYTVTTGSQATFVFSDTGRLLSRTDAKGNALAFTYDEMGLRRVEEPVSGQALTFSYDENGRLSGVSDAIDRTTHFDYNALGHLITITDTRQMAWQYDYTQLDNGAYILSHVIDPDGRTVEHTGFDEFGRAITQTFAGQELSIAYHQDGRRVITYGSGAHTQTDIHVYNAQDLLVAAADNNRQLATYVLDGYQNRTYEEDRNGNATRYEKTPLGYTTAVTDALSNTLLLEYDERNNWTRREDARGEVTWYEYDEHSNLLTETNQLSDTVTYTYNPQGQMTSRTDENDVTTAYGFDSLGRMVAITNALEMTSTYQYDAVGRLITATDEMGRMTVNVYDGGDNLIRVTENYLPDAPQNYLDQYNLVTQYGYDGAGHQIAITDTLGRVNLTLYDVAGRVVTEVTNYDGVTPFSALCTDFNNPDPEYNLCSLTEYDELGRVVASIDSLGRIQRTFYDELGRVAGTVDNWNPNGTILSTADLPNCLNLPDNRDEDICNLYGHDAVGNSTVMTDTIGRVTRTYYDKLNRIEGMILNWDGTTTLTECLSLPVERDSNICTWFGYDEVGNTTVITDTLGQLTRTYYDELGRTEYTVRNWNPDTFSDPEQDCVFAPNNTAQENICTHTEYDAAGNQTVVTNPLGQRTLTVYDGMNRPFIRVTNWDGVTTISDAADCQFPPQEPDSNLCTVTLYDEQGRPTATIDPLGNQTEMAYDSFGRVVTTTRYLEGTPVQQHTIYNAVGNRVSQTDAEGNTVTFRYDRLDRPVATISAEGVVVTQTYDAAGRVVSTTNNLGQDTTMEYDDLDRLVSSTDPEENTTTYEYDLLGNQVAVIDANNVRTGYAYDAMQRLVQVTENDTGGSQTDDSNVVTTYAYDALGNQTRVVNARHFTSTQIAYDALYRPVTVTDALDQETTTAYNALGLRTAVTDANGETTRYQYDGLSRPLTITYESDGQTVSYVYNALGSRLRMDDGVGTTRYRYDDLYRLTTVTDTIDAPVEYGYDLVGNRTHLTYPDGNVITYTYDGDNRLSGVLDWDGNDTTYEYDTVGRLITTTLPNGVYAVQAYDHASRLLDLRYLAADDSLLAAYEYEVDGVGNRQVVTETLLSPEIQEVIAAYQEANGVLALEAENGAATPGLSGGAWVSQTVQTGYGGTGYARALPDVGQRREADATDAAPRLSFPIHVTNPDDYTVWVRGMAPDAAGDSLHVGINGQPVDTATSLTGFGREWGWSRLTMSDTLASLPLSDSSPYTLDLWMREDGLRLDRVLLVSDTMTTPTGLGPAGSPFQVITITTPPALSTHVIDYDYDDLYRLTAADYSGAITAAYRYTYDPVGNMTAYTETIGAETTRVMRTFDKANRLQTAFDYDDGTTSYLYDDNGNLTRIMPPGDAAWLHYAYDQRNLMISHTLSASGANPQLQAEYIYDGTGNRVQQVDHTGAAPLAISYTNDVAGLTQVLVADDGAEQVYNLFGLDLIGQDEGSQTRILLADGLGSVRMEMVENDVESVTTYGPYGNLLAQAGNDEPVAGTNYGYTGEQHDASTDLLYLRARYYNPALRSFMGRDPWSGNGGRPQSMNGWSYVENNPVNLTDPTGMFPDWCKTATTDWWYADCVRLSYLVRSPWGIGGIARGNLDNFQFNKPQSDKYGILGSPGCFYGAVPYRATGYLEGRQINLLAFWRGKETVYDFATLERHGFSYIGAGLNDSLGLQIAASQSAGIIYGFRSWRDIRYDYSDMFILVSGGVGTDFGIPVGAGVGRNWFWGFPDVSIHGTSYYVGVSGGFDAIPVLELAGGALMYDPNPGNPTSYVQSDGTVLIDKLLHDISHSVQSGFLINIPLHAQLNRLFALPRAFHYARVYEDMHTKQGPK